MTPEEERDLALSKTVIEGFDRLPILSRLEFVRDLLLNKGGEKGSVPFDPHLVIAAEILKGVIEVVASRPRTAKLRRPEPN